MREFLATGRRKTSVAQIRMALGSGKVTVNKKPVEDFFPVEINRKVALMPLELSELLGKFDVKVNVNGGGTTGQTGAIQLALARALTEYDAELRGRLKTAGMFRRDPRAVERKKYGQKKARKRFQFSKR
jgi:small subunit ribosomal protein S9